MATGNDFLDQLSRRDLAALSPHLKRRRLERDEVLVRDGEPVALAVLPVTCIISVLVEMSDGAQVETRTIGCEGGFGLLHALGSAHSFETLTVQIAGEAFVIDTRDLAAQARRSGALTNAIVRHAQAALVQSARSVACNGLHDAKSRMCRWLLMTQDRVKGDELSLTQQHLSIMLSVQRTTVSAMAAELQERGIISYRRGRIQVLDRQRLLDSACECYAWINRSAAAVLSDDDIEDGQPYLGPA
jgi:CRP-like cAMP-binding protein